MVPLSLTLRNFLSYGENDVTLDFNNLHVVCLSGENGHGKSAILDAITWALWGETRLGKQGHELLIRIGADEMAVTLVFRVGTDIYRVKRQRSRRTVGQNWEVQRSIAPDEWKPLTGISSVDTARIIQQIVRMSYDTFLNSAYLKQGRADEFVRQTSNKRKEILCDILELSKYDRLEESAKTKIREMAELSTDAERQINQLLAIAGDAERYANDLKEVESTVQRHRKVIAELGIRKAHLDSRRSDTLTKLERRSQLSRSKKTAEQNLNRVKNDILVSESEIRTYNNIISDRTEIKAQYQLLNQSRHRERELRPLIEELHRVELKIHELESLLAQEKQRLTQQLAQMRKALTEAFAHRNAADSLTKQLKSLSEKKVHFEDLEADRDKTRRQYEELAEEFALLKHQSEQIESEIAAENVRLGRIKNQCELCSVCGSPLPPDKIQSLIEESQLRSLQLAERQSSIKQQGSLIKKNLQTVEAEAKGIENRAKAFAEIINEEVRLEQQVQFELSLSANINEIQTDVSEIEQLLLDENFSIDIRKELAEFVSRRYEFASLHQEQTALDQKIASLSRAEANFRNLIGADASLTKQLQIADLAEKQAQLLIDQIAQINIETKELQHLDEDFAAIQAEISLVEGGERETLRFISQGDKDIGRLEKLVEQCAEAASRAKEIEGQRDKYRLEETLYKQLASAFGKRGIQSAIIENALPELQDYTNLILERLTDGDLRVFLETTKQAKTKNAPLIETLEIKISDSLGTRPLEMYSGGEAFRVSFALRIALSMLLVRRAGAELQTLIIDEGFGTQDSKGREKLVDAINIIKEDFELILVITHIDELKEAFATRIEVYKTSEGSQLRVVHGDAIG